MRQNRVSTRSAKHRLSAWFRGTAVQSFDETTLGENRMPTPSASTPPHEILRPGFSLVPQAPHGLPTLVVEGLPLSTLLGQAQTPLFVTSLGAVRERAKAYRSALAKAFPRSTVLYALKANPARAILSVMREEGLGLDLVSLGEWKRGMEVGFSREMLSLAGVGKRVSEIREAVAGGVGRIHVEHLQELDIVLALLSDSPSQTEVGVRLNPEVDSPTHPHLRTGSLDSKFGILTPQFLSWLAAVEGRIPDRDARMRYLAPLRGLHVHVGSQLMSTESFPAIVRSVLRAAAACKEAGVRVDSLDLGGGLRVDSPPDVAAQRCDDIHAHVDFLCATLKDVCNREFPGLSAWWGGRELKELEVLLEPGRSLVASSTALLAEVLYTKENSPEQRFCVVDAGMNDFPRPALYQATHDIRLVQGRVQEGGNAPLKWSVVGPVCESADVLARGVPLGDVHPEDVVAFLEAGAYCRSMASTYNLRPIPAALYLENGEIKSLEPAVSPPL